MAAARDSFESVDWVMAYHEAGHAVVGLALGVPFTRVTLSGVNVRPGAFDLANPHDIERDAVFTMAGEIAAACVDEDATHTAEDDRKHVEELSIDRHPENPEERTVWKAEMERGTEALVRKHWSDIKLLAAHLLERKALSHAEVSAHLKWQRASKQSIIWNGDL